MIRSVDNPYLSPSSQDMKGSRQGSAAFSSHAIRFATLGVVVGVGFGFVILAMTLRSSLELSSPDTAHFTIDYGTPLLAFVFWTITVAAFLGVFGGAIGLVADLLRPTENVNVDGVSDPHDSSINRD